MFKTGSYRRDGRMDRDLRSCIKTTQPACLSGTVKTKKQREKYKSERKTLFDFSEERNNLDAWEEYLNKIEKEIT